MDTIIKHLTEETSAEATREPGPSTGSPKHAIPLVDGTEPRASELRL